MSHGIDRRVPPNRLLRYQVKGIRWLARKSVMSQEDLSSMYKTTQSNVSYIVRGLTHT